MQAVMMNFQTRMIMQQRQKDSLSGEANRREGEKFLAENRSHEGVKTTASGLQYQVLTAGTGPRPQQSSLVTVHYKGTLLDGTEFDSSYRHGQPATFTLNQVIPGWTEGVQLMNVGSKYRFWIPSHLAYGPQGSPPDIPPDAVLVFEIELISFK
jgi:FKBP-type peptidyl-prolyl cis-trans isomerase FkpA